MQYVDLSTLTTSAFSTADTTSGKPVVTAAIAIPQPANDGPATTPLPEMQTQPLFAQIGEPAAGPIPTRKQVDQGESTSAQDLAPEHDAGNPWRDPLSVTSATRRANPASPDHQHRGDLGTRSLPLGFLAQGDLHRTGSSPEIVADSTDQGEGTTPQTEQPVPRELTVGLAADNYGSPDVGSEQLTLRGRYRNAAIAGDELTGRYGISLSEGLDAYELGYRLPLSPMGGGLQVQVAGDTRRATPAELSQYDLRGSGQTYRLSYGQPIHQTPQSEWGLSLGARYQTDTVAAATSPPLPLAFAPYGTGTARILAVEFAQTYKTEAGGGQWQAHSQFTVGSGQFDGTQGTPTVPSHTFFYWQGLVQRSLALSDRHELKLEAALQLAANALLGPEQFTIGGIDSVRGYRQERSRGDNGLRLSLSDRITLQKNVVGDPTLQLIPFIDAGTVWNTGNHATPQLTNQFLLGAGLGLHWQFLEGLTARLDWGLPLISVPRLTHTLQDSGIYLQLDYEI